MKKHYQIIYLALIYIFLNQNSIAQQDFNNFQTLLSKGQIPDDFSSLTYQKIIDDTKSEKRNLSENQEKVFLQGIHYGIDDILHSGLVIYGDGISTYVKSISDKLLEKNSDLKSKLRFYTIKSNESNAFSTAQGIIFITTGLISQLSNEAQLAFILAHEISHYTEKHVVESFKFRTSDSERGKNIRELSVYSKEKEFDADRLALKWYNEAGYSKTELLTVFDVLTYSYLPFEEVEFPKDYFNSENMEIPTTLFPTQKYEIKTNEDYNDNLSSHPNSKKRKEKITLEIEAFSEWGNENYLFGIQKFEEIQTICRFERIRTDVINANYVEAMYSIFLLEQKFPNSIYLKRMKAHSWLGLTQLQNTKDKTPDYIIYTTSDKSSNLTIKEKYEGEIGTLYHFIDNLDKNGVATIALRQIYDLKNTNFNDPHINGIYSFLINELASSSTFKLEQFSALTYVEAKEQFLNNVHKDAVIDTLLTIIPNDKATLNFGEEFYLYGIRDIISDTSFLDNYKTTKQEIKVKNDAITQHLNTIATKQRKNLKTHFELDVLQLGSNEVIIVEPTVYYYKRDVFDPVKSEKLKNNFSTAIDSSSSYSDVKVTTIDRETFSIKGTEFYNERNLLFNFMSQVYLKENDFPVDFELLNEIKLNHGTSKVIFSVVQYESSPKLTPTNYALGFITFMLLPIYIPRYVIFNHNTKMNLIVFDIEKGKVEAGLFYNFKDTPTKYHIAAHMYDIFENLKIKKNNF